MSDKQIASAIAGLTGIAGKVFEVVPIAEGWTTLQIMSELKRLNLNHDFTKVDGCLRSMLEQNLVRYDDGRWQRAQKVTRQLALAKPATPDAAPAPVVAAPAVAATVSPMDSMLATASSMREAGRHLLAQADALESACLAQMDVEAAYKAQMAHFDQLRTLLAAIGKSGVA